MIESAPRTGLCLTCRTALVAGAPCDLGDDHVVVSLVDPIGREAALTATWGDPEVRDAITRTRHGTARSKVAAVVGGAAGAVMLSVPVIESMGLAVIGALLGGGIGWAASLGATRRTWHPAGGVPVVTDVGRGGGRRGEVVGSCELVGPASGTECVAWALELRDESARGQRVMLRDAETAGFDLHLEGGGLARIPAGRIRLVGVIQQQIDVDEAALTDHLARLLPGHERQQGTTGDPFHANVIYEQIVLPGDNLELVSVFEPTPSPRADPALYRDAPATHLRPRGVAVVRVLGRSR